MSNIGAILLLSEKQLRWLSVVVGLLFVGIAAYIRFTAELKPGETFAVLAIPLFTGIAMLAAVTFIKRVEHLRTFYVVWFVGIPALFWIVNSIGCGAHFFSEAWCR